MHVRQIGLAGVDNLQEIVTWFYEILKKIKWDPIHTYTHKIQLNLYFMTRIIKSTWLLGYCISKPSQWPFMCANIVLQCRRALHLLYVNKFTKPFLYLQDRPRSRIQIDRKWKDLTIDSKKDYIKFILRQLNYGSFGHL